MFNYHKKIYYSLEKIFLIKTDFSIVYVFSFKNNYESIEKLTNHWKRNDGT